MTTCAICGEPMPAGEEMFNYHGYSGPCPKPAAAPPAEAPGEVEAMDAIVAAFNTWPDDLRKKLSLHDLRRMTGWRPAAPAAPAEGVMGWATPDGRVCSTRDKAMALVQDASAYTIPLAPRVTGGRAVVERKIRWREKELERLRGEEIQVSTTVEHIGRHETALADLYDIRAALQAATGGAKESSDGL